MLVILSSATSGRHDEKWGHHSQLDSKDCAEVVERDYLIGIQMIPGRTHGGHKGSFPVYRYLVTTIEYYPATLLSTLLWGYCTSTWVYYTIEANKPFH